MIGFVAQNFKLNRILLRIIGLWPLEQSNLTLLQFIFMSVIMMAGMICQFMAFITLRCTPDLIIEMLSYISFCSTAVIHYNLFRLNMEAMKDLLMELQNVCNGLKDKNEIAIMEEYSTISNRYTALLTIAAIGAILFFVIAVSWSNILHIIFATNVIQSRRLPFPMEFLVDQEKYFYWIILYLAVAICVGTIALIGIGSLLIAYAQYTCGMFRISSYRIRCAMHINTLKDIKSKKENLILKGMISAINIHQHAMKLSKLLASSIESTLLCLIFVGVLSLSLNLFRVFQIVTSEYNFNKLLIPAGFIFAGISHMFITNYIAQNITNHNNDVFVTVNVYAICISSHRYDVQWHVAPLHIQKVILFLLQKGNKDFILNAGGLFYGSLECFATLVKTSFSYFTVMYSTQ